MYSSQLAPQGEIQANTGLGLHHSEVLGQGDQTLSLQLPGY